MLWAALVAALLPLELGDVVARLPHLAARLQGSARARDTRSPHDRSGPHQANDFRRLLQSRISEAA